MNNCNNDKNEVTGQKVWTKVWSM